MARRRPQGRLELTWMGKDQALVPDSDGKYDYSWADPADPRATEVKSLDVLRTVGDENAAADNLAIIGESGDALRTLATVPELADQYAGQVKLVYIDPPFNTGQTFEHFEDQLEHSVWLTMMRDRLRWLRPLLARDASIWVHVDEAESHRMRVLLDEEFGAQNFVAEIAWQKTYAPDNRATFTQMHDTILVYAVYYAAFKAVRNPLPRTAAQDAAYQNPDNDPRGPWKPGDFTAQAEPGRRASQIYTLTTPIGNEFDPPAGACWRFTQERYQELLADDRVWFGPDGQGRPAVKRFLSEVTQGRVPTSWWPYEEVGHNQDAKREIGKLFPGTTPFSTPKPERLLQRVIQIGSNLGDLVLDFFGGSGTTAAVAHKMGRRWVTVELQEANAEKYLLPRLSKVVDGTDRGGISTSVERVADGKLPDGVTTEDAKDFNSILNKVVKLDDVEIPANVLRAIKKATKTRNETTVNWSGGGGFTVAKIGPTMYEVDEETGEVYLSEAATNGVWSTAVAGQLGFRLDAQPPFVGTKNRMRLAVLDGVVASEDIEHLVTYLGQGERLTVVAKQVLPGAEETLSTLAPGSRLRRAPDQIIGGH